MLHHLPRRWPKPGLPALAIAAAAVVSAAVLPAVTTTAAASPTHAAAGIARLGAGPASRQVLMLNGDRLLLGPGAGSSLTTLFPAPFGKAVLTLRLAGAIYQIPVDALPYIGHGLDPQVALNDEGIGSLSHQGREGTFELIRFADHHDWLYFYACGATGQ